MLSRLSTVDGKISGTTCTVSFGVGSHIAVSRSLVLHEWVFCWIVPVPPVPCFYIQYLSAAFTGSLVFHVFRPSKIQFLQGLWARTVKTWSMFVVIDASTCCGAEEKLPVIRKSTNNLGLIVAPGVCEGSLACHTGSLGHVSSERDWDLDGLVPSFNKGV